MSLSGYYRFPTIHGNSVAFVSEDDLWTVDAEGGVARRLTSGLAAVSHPFYSPDGEWIAYTGREEGHNEVYIIPASGGPVKRLTYLGVATTVIGWSVDGSRVLFTSDHEQPIDRIGVVYSVSCTGGMPVREPIGPAVSISVASGNRTVIGRNNNDPARWKRYKGGTAGDIWIDAEGSGQFKRLIKLNGNIGRPMWLGERVFFLSDHDGVGNIYSTTPIGDDLRQHTYHSDFYVRYPSTDGTRIVYHAGADLFVLDPSTSTTFKIELQYFSQFAQRQRRFVDAGKYMDYWALSPKGDMLALTSRGQGFALGHWEGSVLPITCEMRLPLRTRLAQWLSDGKRIAVVVDREGEEALEIHTPGKPELTVRFGSLDIGKAIAMKPSPDSDRIAISNHRHELLIVDAAEQTLTHVDKSNFTRIVGFDWSPDGSWLAYAFAETMYTQAIRVWNRNAQVPHTVTRPMLADYSPSFDPDGKYLYFIGQRDFNPVYDSLHFDLGFPRGSRPYVITLQAATISPFLRLPHAPGEDHGKAHEKSKEKADEPSEEAPAEGKGKGQPPFSIDLEGIQDRVVAIPVGEGRYDQIVGIHGKVLFSSYPIEGAVRPTEAEEYAPRGVLESWDLKEHRHEILAHRISGFSVSANAKALIYSSNHRLRVIAAGSKPDEKAAEQGRKSGWVDLARVRISVDPVVEWKQMAREAWRLQRDHFWTENMSSVDWHAVWLRYSPLIDRVGSRGEFSDLMWEMQGELGTSHAYESGGDYRHEPAYPQGFLGANMRYDSETETYRFERVLRGDAGDKRASSPLITPGVNVKPGDLLLAVNGLRLSESITPFEALTNQANQEVTLTVQDADRSAAPRDVNVVTLRSETQLRYRDWVEQNRARVHEATDGRVGYVHIPDMGAHGYAEFHRLYLSEVDRDAMIVDVRYNRGGHVSQLLLEKLSRKRVGYCVTRWGQPDPYPNSSVGGPIVALTNQYAGSDGDIFSHVFKLMNLGTLIGKRTWGGVIGIWPRNPLADGTITTQPEYSFWFKDVGWAVENYGTDPHIDIDITPQDYATSKDPQMEKALEVILDQLRENPVVRPTFESRPSLELPWKLS